ncbi:UDP-glucose 4-epimerase GalE [Chroococcus sp. FPU101]|uniref:UDP-glucose 4-epimerase GalE n=1 Tax=Chroococcus sp. FPU101 TaxID=1974212 RepID=UPI001A8D877D|nr:UDP-glucose 4-epimerase GalE [Chroococcus sp. FPU101]GFE68203.1 UDP-glucose 4-epimerase [Chroococcus sp. FPU101]
MSSTQPKILVTGGAGYIGSHAVLALQRSGFEVLVLDNLVYGHRDLIENVLQVPLIVGDTGDRLLLDHVFATYDIAAVMHFAAYAYVGESTVSPDKYYRNNVVGTLTLLEAMLSASIDKFVFSSTCATYGKAQTTPIYENHPQAPINPYGASKLMVEQILQDFNAAFGLKSVTFRYFNASGADPSGMLGEDHSPETHLLPLVLLTALGQQDSVSVFGTDYATPDGTCIRDYIHVADIAQAHVLGLKYLLQGGHTEVFNLGNGNGFSVKQVIDTARQVTQKDILAVEHPRRLGDPPMLVGSSEKARKILDWHPQYSDLTQIISHAWQWHQKRHNPEKISLEPQLTDSLADALPIQKVLTHLTNR